MSNPLTSFYNIIKLGKQYTVFFLRTAHSLLTILIIISKKILINNEWISKNPKIYM